MSRKTSTTPRCLAISDRGGTVVNGALRPSLADKDRVVRQPSDAPPASTFRTGLSTGWRLSSLMIRKTASSGWPAASPCVQPVNASATGFMKALAVVVRGDHGIADAGERDPQHLVSPSISHWRLPPGLLKIIGRIRLLSSQLG